LTLLLIKIVAKKIKIVHKVVLVFKNHIKKTCGAMEIKLHILTTMLDGGQ
jgi:hypothetical protein